MPFGPGGPLPHCPALHPRREGGVHSISAGQRHTPRRSQCPQSRRSGWLSAVASPRHFIPDCEHGSRKSRCRARHAHTPSPSRHIFCLTSEARSPFFWADSLAGAPSRRLPSFFDGSSRVSRSSRCRARYPLPRASCSVLRTEYGVPVPVLRAQDDALPTGAEGGTPKKWAPPFKGAARLPFQRDDHPWRQRLGRRTSYSERGQGHARLMLSPSREALGRGSQYNVLSTRQPPLWQGISCRCL